jgi:hypothetical protein
MKITIESYVEIDLCPERDKLRLVPNFGVVTNQSTSNQSRPSEKGVPMAKAPTALATFTLADNQQVTCTITGTDSKGNPTPLPTGSVVWSVDIPTVIAITPSADTLSCLLVAVGPLGTANVSVSVNDPSGNSLASGQLAVTVVGSAPVTITVVPGAPVPQP